MVYATAPSVPRDAAHGNAQGERDHLAIGAVGRDSAGRAIDVVLHVTLGSMRELEVTADGAHDGTADEIPAFATLRPTGRAARGRTTAERPAMESRSVHIADVGDVSSARR